MIFVNSKVMPQNPSQLMEVIGNHPGFEFNWVQKLGFAADILPIGAAVTWFFQRWKAAEQLLLSEKSAALLAKASRLAMGPSPSISAPVELLRIASFHIHIILGPYTYEHNINHGHLPPQLNSLYRPFTLSLLELAALSF